jgi:glucokinase
LRKNSIVILAGDIGGTKTWLATITVESGQLIVQHNAKFPSREFASLSDVVQTFLRDHPATVEAACFGIAGAVIDGVCRTTNLPWVVAETALSQVLGTPQVKLLNDLEATAYSLEVLTPDDVVEIQSGNQDTPANRAVIAAGTGLGEAGIFWNGRQYVPFASEGGHADFAARDELEIELLRYLIGEFGHASWERVLSGPGLVNVYRFLCKRDPSQVSAEISVEMQQRDPAAVIAQAAQQRRCPLCMQALEMFVSLYGSEAGNLALKLMSRGGLYIAGGIASKIIDQLRQPVFLESIRAKGRFQSLLQSIPVRIVITDRAALLGAAHYANRMLLGT